MPPARWSCPEPAREVVAQAIACSVSASTVRRRLTDDALKPWQHQSWILITDPGFRTRAERVLGLYARTWRGVRLGEDEYVISADEKTSVQARCRCHPTLAPGQARAMRVFWIVGNGSSHRGEKAADRLGAFEDRCNATAQPFQWKFTTSDLDDLPARLDRHTTDHHEESSAEPAT
ncbi:hypothetical protein [Streptomyces scabiei]|uniref:Transposase n=1 Tax=Streptomyces scabiei TaxID=1930 RepID=A0A124C4X6_STRSC|nr:hypothetical protein [Streptomyces scabiei]GAQ65813.1 hypothetical protein SsS58_06228 [Streptomyces scabiei]